ncbi:helix-turn-helix transcriptional regulator [Salinarimonas sp. NSM]|uniref:helix-turn-helix transcriptional regulator n=1 Tax=Salinarimonas sp. NSM TaxID=3458003 RepID=UPI004035F768
MRNTSPESNLSFEIIDRISAAAKLDEGHAVLRENMHRYDLKHVAYLGLNIPSERRRKPLVAVTYSPEWQRHYEQSDYVNIDPVVSAGLGGILPIDWTEIDRSRSTIRKVFGEAQEFDVGMQGLSFPIRGRYGEFALFSINADVPARNWPSLKKMLIKEFMVISYYFHSWALQVEQIEQNDYAGKLSEREKECLRWSAAGKTIWDTSAILGLSERTVRFHLENARSKLNALSTTHAVSKAISYGVIPLP